jgi:hypothetical protein
MVYLASGVIFGVAQEPSRLIVEVVHFLRHFDKGLCVRGILIFDLNYGIFFQVTVCTSQRNFVLMCKTRVFRGNLGSELTRFKKKSSVKFQNSGRLLPSPYLLLMDEKVPDEDLNSENEVQLVPNLRIFKFLTYFLFFITFSF